MIEHGELYSELYAELHEIATRRMKRERPDHTLQPTELLDEAYVRLSARKSAFKDRQHFLAVASLAMRNLLIEWARSKGAEKNGGGLARSTLNSLVAAPGGVSIDTVIEMERAMEELESVGRNGKRAAELFGRVSLGGLTATEAAGVMGISRETATRDLRFAKAWLRRRLSQGV